MPSTLLNTLIIAAGLPLLTMTAAPVEASPAWKRAVPYPEASRVATTAANAVISGSGSEECLRGKLANAIVQLSNSCDASNRSSPSCELASNIAGQESELNIGEMISTSETLLQMLADEASTR